MLKKASNEGIIMGNNNLYNQFFAPKREETKSKEDLEVKGWHFCQLVNKKEQPMMKMSEQAETILRKWCRWPINLNSTLLSEEKVDMAKDGDELAALMSGLSSDLGI